MNDKDILLAIEDGDGSFTRSQKIVAAHILAEPNESAMLTIQDLAARTNVSEATIVRFAQTLGLPGYQELRDRLRQRLMQSISASRRIQETLTDLEDSDGSLQEFTRNQAAYLEAISESVGSSEFNQTCSLIAAAGNVYLFADGAATTPMNALQFWLNRFGLAIIAVSTTGRRLFDHIIRAGADDVLVCFVFGKQNRDALFLLDWARSRSVGTVVITDVHDGSILGLATHALFVERGPMVSFHSMAPPLLLSEAIALTVARIRGEETIQNAALLDETRKRYGLE